MSTGRYWDTSFLRQCFVTAGVSLNMLSHGLVAGYTAILLPQLRAPESTIKVNKTSESWIASVFGITFIVGNLFVSVLMDKLGRKKSNLISIAIVGVGWYVTVWSTSATMLIVCRIIQGISLGISIHLCPTMLGEYTSPRYRGAFLATLTLAISSGILVTHSLGSYLRWQTTALVCAIITTIDFLLVCFAPETPAWLMNKRRYEEGKWAFRWLRGLNEEEELTRMIQENVAAEPKRVKENVSCVRRFMTKLNYLKQTVVKEEFYKPSLIVIHLYIIGQWGGTTVLSQFAPDVFFYVVGDKTDLATMVVILAVHRFLSGIYMTFLMGNFKRRIMVIILVSVAVFSLLSIAAYTYARNTFAFDYPAIGIILIHMHMVSVSSGCVGIGFIIAGELFPLEYKGLAGGLSAMSMSVNVFIMAKTGPYFLADIGISIAYCIYAAVVVYSLVIVVIFLPETHGRTLQDIEDGFRKRRPLEDTGTSEPLTNGQV